MSASATQSIPEKRIFRQRRYEFGGLILLLIVVAGITDFLVSNPGWKWEVVARYLFHPDVLRGVKHTLLLTFVAGIAGIVCGIPVAFLRLTRNRPLRALGSLYLWLIRAIPPLVMLLIIYFLAALVPVIHFGIPYVFTVGSVETNQLISKFSAAVLGLTLYQAGYGGEIYRSGILAVSRGQYEGAIALGMNRFRYMRRIIVPQAIRVIIPPLSNELITLFKHTSLVSIVGFTELLTSVQLIYAVNHETIPLLTVACIWYLLLTSLAMLGQRAIEKRFNRGFG